MRKFVTGWLCLLLLLLSVRADAAGFGIYEWSARGNALGGAMVGRADDPSTIAYNPAGMVQLEGTQFMAGFTAISPTVDMEGFNLPIGWDSSASTLSATWFPPHIYYTRQVNENHWFGVGLFTRFGLGTEFDPGWFGRYNSTNAEITSVSLNPSWAWKLNDKVSVGVGIEAMYFGINLQRQILAGPVDIGSELEGDSFGLGWNLGLLFKPVEEVRIGLAYRSSVEQDVEGDLRFSTPVPGVLTNTNANGKITLPDLFSAGVFWQATPRLGLEIDAVLTRWSTYDKLTIRYDDPVNGKDFATSPKDWNDTWRYQLGIEYALNDKLDLRLGYVIDPSPIPDHTVDYILPTNDRKLYSIGLGFKNNDWNYDLSYTYLDIEPRDIAYRDSEGVFQSRQDNGDAHLFGVSVSRKF